MDNAIDEWAPKKGMEFTTTEDAWQFWVSYGGKMGFNVCKQYENKNKEGKVTTKRFVCSKEGLRVKDKRDNMTKHPRAETRTNCQARMGISLDRRTGTYHVHDFVAAHNHLLQLPECSHMMPSQRKMTNAQAFQVELADDSGIAPRATYELMSRQVGGGENLGYTRQDQKNYLRSRRQRDLEFGEEGNILKYFQKKSLQDPSFYQAVQLDNFELVTNVFWADARMLIDYSLFGDVVTFDTTYLTNKEYRPFGVFVGFNNHRGVVIFGACLLYDETSESFAWLFDKFLEAHNQKKPKTIFTDQDAAMAKALTKVMPDTRHGLCTWHIMQNGIKHHGNLMKDGFNFLRDVKKLMYEYEDESIFEESWQRMLTSYSVQNSSWLENIYKVKEKWAKCYMKTACTIGMKSTQLSESLNGDLKDYLKSSLDIAQFFKHFERVVNAKRYDELQAEYHAREKLPRMKVKTSLILKQVAQIYTPAIFELFQEEWERSFEAYIKNQDEPSTMRDYVVGIVNQEVEYKVTANQSDQVVSCSCRKFEQIGFLCCHALKVLDRMDVKLIPERYIIKRWSREARNGSIREANRDDIESKSKMDVTDRYRDLCPQLVKLATRASDYEKGYILVKNACLDLNKKLDDIIKEHNSDTTEPRVNSSTFGESVEPNDSINNLFEKVKGLKKKDGRKGGKRPKSWVEKQPKKKNIYNKEKRGTSKGDKWKQQSSFSSFSIFSPGIILI